MTANTDHTAGTSASTVAALDHRVKQGKEGQSVPEVPQPFLGPIPWMVDAAVILSAVTRHWPDFGVVLVLLLANAVVGVWEEREAGEPLGRQMSDDFGVEVRGAFYETAGNLRPGWAQA